MKSKGSISIGGGFLESHLIIDIEPLFTANNEPSPRLRETLATVPDRSWKICGVTMQFSVDQSGLSALIRCLVERIPGTVTVAAAFLDFTCRSIQIP